MARAIWVARRYTRNFGSAILEEGYVVIAMVREPVWRMVDGAGIVSVGGTQEFETLPLGFVCCGRFSFDVVRKRCDKKMEMGNNGFFCVDETNSKYITVQGAAVFPPCLPGYAVL
jgi:hypothetical protein